jgi:hypothetical protein
MYTLLLTTANKVKDKSIDFIKKSGPKLHQPVLILSSVTALFISIDSYGHHVSGITAKTLHTGCDNTISASGAGIDQEHIFNVRDIDREGDTTKTRIPASVQPDGFLLVNHKLVMVKQGIITRMDKDIRLSNGAKVLREGYVVKPNGYIILINQGEYLNMTGKIVPINKSDVFLELQ